MTKNSNKSKTNGCPPFSRYEYRHLFFLNNVESVRRVVERQSVLHLPFVTAAELLAGAKHSTYREKDLARYREFLSECVIIYADRATLDVYSDLRVALRRSGRTIPHNDTWLAAVALQYDAILVTNDKHFAVVPGLRTENWLS